MISFRMSGQRYDFDEEQDLTAAEMFAFEDYARITLEEGALDVLALQLRNGSVTGSALRILCVLAWIAHRRAGGVLEWGPFTESISLGSIEVLDDAPVAVGGGDGGPRRDSSTRKRPKSRTKRGKQ